MRIVPGILGRAPYEGTCVAHQAGGERKVGARGESGYPNPFPPDTQSSLSSGSPNPRLTPQSEHPIPLARSNLSRFVGHLWKGSPSKSFVAVVRSEPAVVIRVKMHLGGGRKNFYGPNQGWGRGSRGQGWGGGAQGRGQGRGGPGRGRGNNVWDSKDHQEGNVKKVASKEAPSNEEKDDENWEKAAEKTGENQGREVERRQEIQENKQGNITPKAPEGPRNLPNPAHNRVACENYGLFNHLTRDCRRFQCEIYGLNNHTTYDCKWCVLWNTSPEVCAAQVEDQSFFFIEECIDPRVAREKENIAVIHAVQGHVTAKQIEQQFMYLAGSSTWKWNARQVGENRFVMRFPNAKMIMDWGHIKAFAMNDVDAFLKVEQWSPKLGAKGMLQQAWFRVKDIPGD